MSEDQALTVPTSNKDLFVTFTRLALQGFGGVLPIAQRVLCEQKRWLSKEQFVEILALGQVLPGPNVCNVALMVGDRFFGWRGAFSALAGMMAVPLVIVLIITALYSEYASHPMVAGALKGMGAVSAGLIIGSALKLVPTLKSNPMGVPVCAVIACIVFGLVALLRWPLVWVLLGIGVVACCYAAMKIKAIAALNKSAT
jgi:chromate transporter